MLIQQLPVMEMFPSVLAQVESSGLPHVGVQLVAAVIFSTVGVIVFFGCLLLMEKLTPFSIVKEIGDEHNTAVAIIVGAMVLGISIIIAAAIVG